MIWIHNSNWRYANFILVQIFLIYLFLFRFHTPDEERPFVCKYCPRGFLNQCQLDDHVARAHEGRRPYPCRAQGCSRAFTLPGVRKRHEKRDHNLCINLKRGMRSRSEVNSGLLTANALASPPTLHETSSTTVCQIIPQQISILPSGKKSVC